MADLIEREMRIVRVRGEDNPTEYVDEAQTIHTVTRRGKGKDYQRVIRAHNVPTSADTADIGPPFYVIGTKEEVDQQIKTEKQLFADNHKEEVWHIMVVYRVRKLDDEDIWYDFIKTVKFRIKRLHAEDIEYDLDVKKYIPAEDEDIGEEFDVNPDGAKADIKAALKAFADAHPE